MTDEYPLTDGGRQYPVARMWRPPLQAVIEALRAGDYSLRAEIPMVDRIEDAVARQIQDYVEDYGETIVGLPEESWSNSVSRWMGGHWDVLVDLWTSESGHSDLALSARVSSDGPSYKIRIMGVYVP